jgi:GT2 family glycosyltransferase
VAPAPLQLSVVIVAYGGDAEPVLDALASQKRPGDEVIVVDNLASDGGTKGVRGHAAVDRLIEPDGNLHYAAGCNLGASTATGDALVLLNPDAIPVAGFLEAMRTPPAEWAGWTGVLTLPDAVHINNGGGVVHFLGLAWSGHYGEPLTVLPAGPAPAGFLSGGCFAVRRAVWDELGGYAAGYGAYHEDTELSLRLRLEGRSFGLVPAARVVHEYDFVKSSGKWRNIERNRWKTVVRTYPTPLLLGVLPALLAVEPALLAVGVRRGWWQAKLASYGDLLRWLPGGLRERRAVQARRRVSAREFARGLVAELDSPFFGRAGQSPPVRRLLRGYWRAVQATLPG